MDILAHECKICEYSTQSLGNYKKHAITQKHLRNQYNNDKKLMMQKRKNGLAKIESVICYCGKEFESRSGIWKHRKKCSQNRPAPLVAHVNPPVENFFSLMHENLVSGKCTARECSKIIQLATGKHVGGTQY